MTHREEVLNVAALLLLARLGKPGIALNTNEDEARTAVDRALALIAEVDRRVKEGGKG